jgi:energy-coupling factor transporter ATP-binding protein EcfA2
VIRLEAVSLSIGRSRILHDIDLAVRDGEWIALTGRNGSGKSMLLKLMAGLLQPTSGRVTVDGSHPGSAGADLPVGIAFQNPDSQFVATSVSREVRFGMENLGFERAEIECRLGDAADLFALGALLDRNPHTLSGGEKQRLLLAAIWAMRPRHILLDEPFSFLDEGSRRSALETVRRTFRDEGRAVVWATLDPGELSLADRAICIDDGRIVYDGPAAGAETELPDGVLADDMPAAEGSEGPAGGNTILDMRQAVLAPGGGEFRLTVPALSLRERETLGVTGSSGSGKTTLLLGCAGLLPPREGSLSLFGKRIRSRKDFPAGRIAVLFQSPEEGFFAPTVREEVALANRRFGGGRTDEDAARDALRRAGLDPDLFLDRNPFHLSQGEKRLVALASQLALPARLFLLDEPTLFLDGAARARLAAALDRLTENGAALVVASHDTRFVASRAGRRIDLVHGSISD